MLLFRHEEHATRARHLSTQAKVPHSWEFIHDEEGFNYRMPNINAALGLAQFEQLPQLLADKRLIAEKYSSFFSDFVLESESDSLTASDMTSVSFISEPKKAHSNYWLNSILLPDRNTRDTFLDYTNSHGIMTRPAWRLLNKLPMFSKCVTGPLDRAEFLEDRLVNIPSSARI